MYSTEQSIKSSQKFILAAAYAYNNDIEWISDKVYDMSVKMLKRLKDSYPEEWEHHSIYPEVFVKDEDWTYTSSHFPLTDDVKAIYEDYRRRNG